MEESIISMSRLNNGLKHEISPKKNHLISVLTSLEVTLTNKKKNYFDKVQILLTAWEQITNFVSETSTESPQPAFDFLFINTLRFVLTADWPRCNVATKTHLSVTLKRFGDVLAKSETFHSIVFRCRVLESVVQNPWGHPVLCKILNSQEVDLNECASYFNFENGKVIVVRLEMLLQSKCEDIAVHLSKACLHTYNTFNEDLEGFDTLDFNQEEIDYITDIYFSSLLKTKKKEDLIAEIKKYQLDDGLRLLQRYRTYGVGGKHNEHCKNARVWKCNRKLIDLLSNTLLANAVLHDNLVETQTQLEDLIVEWAAVQTTFDVLPPLALEMIRKFVLIASSSKCVYPFCSFLIRNVNCKEQDINLVARCLIRAINQNMNEVEQFRVNQKRDKLKETYNQLSKGFLLISELFSECKNINKECLLTSFSLMPSREFLEKIETYVIKLSAIVETLPEPKSEPDTKPEMETESNVESKVKTESPNPDNPQVESTTENIVTHDTTELNEIFESIGIANEKIEEKEIDAPLKQVDLRKGSAPAYIAEIENLKLESNIREDLNCILRYQRHHTLTWELDWNELKTNCEQYLENFEKKGFDDVELKYLDLDYNQFKNQPVSYDDCGIEKGYEQFAYSPVDSEEDESSARRSGFSSYDSDDEIISHRKRKKVISSDDESKPRKEKSKRGRKPKIRTDESRPRRNSLKKKNEIVPEDEILDSISTASDPNSLKALRQFRIGGFKPLSNQADEDRLKMAEELNNILEDSCKQLDSFDIPPVSPNFNVYDVILDNTLVPSDSEVRLPKCEDLLNNGNIFEEQKPKEKKRKPYVPRERNNAKKKEPKPPKNPLNRPSVNQSYLNHSGIFNNANYPTLLANDDLFKRKYGSKTKNNLNCGEFDTTILKDCVVQLPKLNENNVSYLDSSQATRKPYGDTNGNMFGFNTQSNVATNVMNDLDQIDNLFVPTDCLNSTNMVDYNVPMMNTTNTNIQPNIVESNQPANEDVPDNNNELNETLLDFVNQQLGDFPSSQMYGSCMVDKAKPTTNTTVDAQHSNVSNLYNTQSFSRASPTKNDSQKVNQILGTYRALCDRFPQLSSVPARRKRANAANPSKRQRSKVKNGTPNVINLDEAFNTIPPANPASVELANTAYLDQRKLPVSSASSQIYTPNTSTYLNITQPNTVPYSPVRCNTASSFVSTKQKPMPSINNGTLKALLQQGPSNGSTSSKVYESMQYYNTVRVHMPVSTSNVTSFNNTPRTYGQSNRPKDPPPYVGPVPSSVSNSTVLPTLPNCNLTVEVPRISVPALTTHEHFTPNYQQQIPVSYANTQKVNMTYTQIPTDMGTVTSTTPAVSYTNHKLPSFTDVASKAVNNDLKGYESLLNNFEVRVPRIDTKIDIGSKLNAYTKPNFYEEAKFSGNSNNEQYFTLDKVDVKNNVISNSQIVPQTIEENFQLQNNVAMNDVRNNVVVGDQFASPVMNNSDVKNSNDLKMPILYATVNTNDMGEMNLSIPETEFAEAYLENYLTQLF